VLARARALVGLWLTLSMLLTPGGGLAEMASGTARTLAPGALRLGGALVALAAALHVADDAQAQAASPQVLVPFSSGGWKYKDDAYDGDSGFQSPSYDVSSWSTGTAAFGETQGNCGVNRSGAVHAQWTLDTDMLLRQRVSVPASATTLIVNVAIDNDVQVWVDGTDISGGLLTSEDCASYGERAGPNGGDKTSAPNFWQFGTTVTAGQSHLVAVRARDRGGADPSVNDAFVDVEVLACTPTTCPGVAGRVRRGWSRFSFDPVDTYTGSYTYAHTDLAIAGRGPSPSFTRFYNSFDTRTSPLGPGWTHTYNVVLTSAGDPAHRNDMVVVQGTGRDDRYTWNTAGSYTPGLGIDAQLVHNGDGTYIQFDTVAGDYFAVVTGKNW